MPSLRDAARIALAAIDGGVAFQHLDEVVAPLLREALEAHDKDYKLTSDRAAAVSQTVYWYNDMRTCPLGAKVLLLGSGGVATIGHYNGKDLFFIAWHPLPKVKK